jgi:hypothetical protein
MHYSCCFKHLLPGILFISLQAYANPGAKYKSPLSDFHALWSSASYNACNTATKAGYLTAEEKEVIHVLNLMRRYPRQFAETVVKKWPTKFGSYLNNVPEYQSLLQDLMKMKPQPLLKPDSILWVSARCHAETSGRTGYVGHARQSKNCIGNFRGECCHYGSSSVLSIVMSLLIDEDVPSLGHRHILTGNYNWAGVSIMPHSEYGYNCVIDVY